MLKNLDHFNKSMPGNFSVYLWDAAGTSTLLAARKDAPTPSMSIVRAQITIPKTAAAGNYIIQAVYNTNSVAHPVFYQCSDVEILGPHPPAAAVAAAEASYKSA